METLSTLLKNRRQQLSMTLREVEEMTGISNPYLSQLENGKISQPSPIVLSKLAETYSLSYAHLMHLARYPTPTRNHDETILFKTSEGLEEITEGEEKELMDYLRFLRMRRKRE